MVFDGLCVFCSRSAHFIANRDRTRRLQFVAAQSATGAALMTAQGMSPLDPSSFIVLTEDGRVLAKSDALLFVAERLGPLWRSLGRALNAVPRPVRDRFYDLVARNRYRIMGRRDECDVRGAELRQRFHD
jgi:predicted DCC family thiol-disulfide oxidoreductase YuxK